MPDKDVETVRRLQQDVVLPQAAPNQRLEKAQGSVQTSKRARKRKKLDYSKDKMLVGELLSVIMRGRGLKGVLETILSYVWWAFFAMRRAELSVGGNIEQRMIMADKDKKDGYVYEQNKHLYTLNSTA